VVANPLLDAVAAAASPSSARSRKSSGRRSASGSESLGHSGPNSSNASVDGGGGGGAGGGASRRKPPRKQSSRKSSLGIDVGDDVDRGDAPAGPRSDSDDDGDDERQGESATPSEGATDADADDDFDDDDDDDDDVASGTTLLGCGEGLTFTHDDVPDRPKNMKTLQETVLDCTVDEFFKTVWSDSARAGFNATCHEKRGERDVAVTKWTPHDRTTDAETGGARGNGNARHDDDDDTPPATATATATASSERRPGKYGRELTFIAPVNASIGPKQTRCRQSQNYATHRGGVLIIDTAQVQLDIPYGDYFRVEGRWEVSPTTAKVRPDGAVIDRCTLWVGLRVPFHRTTMLRTVIEQSTLNESKKSVEIVLGLARATMEHLNREKVKAFIEKHGVAMMENVDEDHIVDASKLNIPEGSKDVIWRMLFGHGGGRKNSGDVTPQGSVNGHSPPMTPRGGGSLSINGDNMMGVDANHRHGGGGEANARGLKRSLAMKHRGGGGGANTNYGAWFYGSGSLIGGGPFAAFAVFALLGLFIMTLHLMRIFWGYLSGLTDFVFDSVFWWRGGGGGDEAYWERKATALELELNALERRVKFVANEVAHARRALAEVRGGKG
jgi:hypothetical protein